jgi:hypothetical protein
MPQGQPAAQVRLASTLQGHIPGGGLVDSVVLWKASATREAASSVKSFTLVTSKTAGHPQEDVRASVGEA